MALTGFQCVGGLAHAVDTVSDKSVDLFWEEQSYDYLAIGAN